MNVPTVAVSALQRRIDDATDRAIAERRIVGTVILVAERGEVVYRRAAGLTDREAGLPMRLDAIFRLASYRQEADRARTEKQAKATCNNPYKIGAGTNGGVLMHLADQAQETELYLKTASDGRVFLGPKGPAGVDSVTSPVALCPPVSGFGETEMRLTTASPGCPAGRSYSIT